MDKRWFNIALVGNPNSGKSSLFNALTGMHQRVGNYPGVTVDKKTGKFLLHDGRQVNLIDLPGTYSLYPKSTDEIIAADVLFDKDENVKIDLIVILADASNLKRNLLFCSQIIDLKKPVVIALSMYDLADKMGIQIDIPGLEIALGVPIIKVNPRKNKGISELKKNIASHIDSENNILKNDFISNKALAPEAIALAKNYFPDVNDYEALHLCADNVACSYYAEAEKKQLQSALKKIDYNKAKVQAEEVIQRYKKIKTIMQSHVVEADPLRKQLFSEKLDSYLLHPFWGYVILFTVLFILFQSIFWLSAYPTDWIDEHFSAFINYLNRTIPKSFLSDLAINGILAGINGIIVFIPQIMILFGLLTILEDSGYMSRISFLSDKLMRKVGLNGKSVMPLMSGFACAVPAIMAARTIENKKEKLITILITPLMSCSARLPVYTILIGLVVPSENVLGIFSLQGIMMMFLYIFGVIMALLMARILHFFIKLKDKSVFLMELPVYRAPRWGNVFTTMFQKARVFVFEAGKVILIISVILWGLSNYGYTENAQGQKKHFTQSDLQHSYAADVGKYFEPAIKPLGFDWRIGIALVTSFAAREVFVGTMATLYAADENDDASLKQKMRAAHWPNGKKVYTFASGFSLLLFYALALQCMSTLAVVKRETNSWKIPLFQFITMSALAYLFSFLAYQIFS